ncbi:odorant receptor 30a-like [Cardiocondyla obscurior]|uniref:odorant receptor 30a-like n=1 Tax=Cardiocondyla obscurior TaxID=286306 RepID=UPI0039656509
MIDVVDKYFSLNRTLLLIIGLWPYEKSKCVVIQMICIFCIVITCIIFQLTTLLTSKCTPDFIVKVLSIVIAFSSFIVKYISFYVNSETIKCLARQLHHIYNDLNDNGEIAIVERYGNNAKCYTIVFTIIFTTGLFSFVGLQLWADFKHTILSSNLSHSHELLIDTEYIIDEEKYFYLMFLHINMTIIIGCIIILATGAMLVAYLQHACGMFKIASYRIEKAINIYYSVSKNIKVQNEMLAHDDIVRAVDMHRKAMTFSTHLISSFEMSFMFLIVIGVLSLSLNIFRIFQVALIEHKIRKLFLNFLAASYCLLYMFMANFIGQQIIDCYNDVFATAYKAQWYKTSLYVQRLIIILLQRGNKNFGLRVGGLFIASIECFATLFNASMSYFTLMYSVR